VFGVGEHGGRGVIAKEIREVCHAKHFGEPEDHLQAGTAAATLDLP
jgi:hypothetical protein